MWNTLTHFHSAVAVDLAESAELRQHGVMVMETVGEVVAGLDTMEQLVPMLLGLAEKHADFKVVSEHFPVLGQALLSTLEKVLALHPGDNPGANRWFLESTPIQMQPPGGSI